MSESYKSGLDGKIRSDCRVQYVPADNGGCRIEIKAKSGMLFDRSIRELAAKTLSDLGISSCTLQIEDFGALPFVIQARIEAAVRKSDPGIKKCSLPEIKPQFQYFTPGIASRRTRLYLPANQPKLMLNAGLHRPDGLILDLEDSVSADEKISARMIARNALRVLDFHGSEKMVRINQGEAGMEDIEQIVPQNVNLILVPKAESAEGIAMIDRKIREVSDRCGRREPVFLIPIIESASGVLNAFGIAGASRNIVGLAIGLEDYTADIGARRTAEGKESLFARSMIVNAAKASGILALDSVFSDVGDDDGLYKSSVETRDLGFDGKGCIHPNQIRIINRAFAPDEKEIGKAMEIILAYESAVEKGMGVISAGSQMVDQPVVKKALKIIETALGMNLIQKDWRSLER